MTNKVGRSTVTYMLTNEFLFHSSVKPMLSFARFYGAKRSSRSRRAVECVEVAVTLPLLMLVTFATAQVAHRWHVEKMLKIATYEAVKSGAMRDGNAADVQRVFREYSTALDIKGASIVFSQSGFNNAAVGDSLQARGIAESAPNRLKLPIYLEFSPNMTTGWVHARKEGL